MVPFFLKRDSTKGNFFKFLKIRLSPPKKCLWLIPILETTYNISEKNIFIDDARQVIVKNIKFETHSKKDNTTGSALKFKPSFKSFGKYLRQIVSVGILLL